MSEANGQLKEHFYKDSGCFGVEEIVAKTVTSAVFRNHGLGAGLLRMHFHDCFVRGCDGSVLIDSTPGNQAEKDSPVNNPSLRGFEVIDAAKTLLEEMCPETVSCADILAFAARDSVFALGGPFWPVKSGRKDGTVSHISDVIANLPPPTFNLQQLTKSFAAKGLSQDEMITLSGAHTIGRSHCSSFSNRLYNYNNTASQDPTLNSEYAQKLKAVCPKGSSDPDTVVPMDPISPGFFDNAYYTDLLLGHGLFTSDQSLFADTESRSSVLINLVNGLGWGQKFAEAMIKMSEIDVKTGQQGEIRKNCHFVNS